MTSETLLPNVTPERKQSITPNLGIKPINEQKLAEQREVKSNANINVGSKMEPYNNDEIARLSTEMKLPHSFIERNYDFVKNQKKEANLKKLRDRDKGLSKWMDTPDKAAAVGGDIESIEEISKLIRTRREQRKGRSSFDRMYDAAVSGSARALSGLAKTPLAIQQLSALPYNFVAKQLDLEQIHAPDYLINNPIIDYYDEVAKSYGPKKGEKGIVENIKSGNMGGAAFSTVLGVIENIPQLSLLAMSGGAGWGSAGLVGMGVTTAGEKLAEKLPQGVSPLDATTEAVFHGGAEIAGEFVTLGLFRKNIMGLGKELVKTMGKDSARKTIGRMLKNVVKDGTSEGLSEAATSISQDVSSYIMGDKESLEGAGARMFESFAVGATIGGGMGTYGSIRQEMQKSGEHKVEQTNLKKLEDIVDKTKIKKENPENAEAMIDNMINGEKVYLSHDAISGFFQSDKKEGIEGNRQAQKETNAFLEDMEIQDQTTSVLSTGGEYEISKAKWLVKHGKSKLADALREDVRFAVDGFNGNDVADIKAGIAEKTKAMQEEIANLENLDDVQPEQLTAMREILMRPSNQGGMGYSAETTDAQLPLMVAAGKFATRYTGESMAQWWARRNPEIKVGGEFEGQAEQKVMPRRDYEKLDADTKVQADIIIDGMVTNLGQEIEEAMAGERGVAPDTAKDAGYLDSVDISRKSTFPEWFKDLKTNKKAFLKAIQNKKGVVYERIKAKSRELLESGYESKAFGQVMPSNEYRSLLGMSQVDSKGMHEGENSFQQDALGFYSKLSEEVDNMQFKSMPAKDLANRISKIEGIKKEELEHTGIIDFLNAMEGKVIKEDVKAFLDQGGLQLEEVVKADINTGALDDAIARKIQEIYEEVLEDQYSQSITEGDTSENFHEEQDNGTYAVFGPQASETDVELTEEEAVNTVREYFIEGKKDFAERNQKELDNEIERQAIERLEEEEGISEETKFSSYTLPGGKNYREVLIRLLKVLNVSEEKLPEGYSLVEEKHMGRDSWIVEGPSIIEGETKKFSIAKTKSEALEKFFKLPGATESTKQKYQSPHWDESNVLAHFRLNDRIDSEGKKTLFIEEIQSDWHQEGRKKGYSKGIPEAEKIRIEEIRKESDILRNKEDNYYSSMENYFGNEYVEEIFGLNEYASISTPQDMTDAVILKDRDNLTEAQFLKEIGGDNQLLDKINSDKELSKLLKERQGANKKLTGLLKELNAHDVKVRKESLSVPDVPFKQTEAWVMFAFKRILRQAAEQGYDAVAWTPGQVQADRYDLSKQISEITLETSPDGSQKFLSAYSTEGHPVIEDKKVKDNEIEDHIGKEAASKLLEAERKSIADSRGIRGEFQTLKSQDLKIGGEGMIGFYDKILPKAIGKYVKKLDKKVKVGVDTIEAEGVLGENVTRYDLAQQDGVTFNQLPPSRQEEYIKKANELNKEGQEVWHLPLTDKLKSKVLAGQALFQAGKKKVPRAAIRFGQNKTVINLFNGADLSSLLHETGHIFIQEMQDIVDSGMADAQLRKDLETLKIFADGNFNADGIEKVARGFETYLKEGKAPSIELQSAFEKFAQWLGTIYANIRGQLPKINDDVRAVFDRMLATNEQINEIEEFNKQKETTAELIDSPAKVKKDAKEKQEIASLSSKQKLLAKKLAIYVKANGGRKGLTAEKTAVIEDDPFYMSTEFAIENGGISTEEALEHYGKDKIKEINAKFKGIISDKGTIPIGDISMRFDLESDNSFIDDLAEQLSKKDKIKEMVDQDIAQAELDLTMEMSDNEGFKGDEEYHTEERLTSIIADYEALRLKLASKKKAKPGRAFDRKVYKAVAREELLKTKTSRATRYDLYGKTEQRYANSSYKLAKEGKLEQALEHKNKQILNHIMVQEAVKLRDQKIKIEKSYQSKRLNSKLSKVENDYAQLSLALINRFALNKKVQATEALKILNDFDENLAEQLPQWVLQGETPTGEKNYKEMSFQDFLTVDETIKSIIHSGKDTLFTMRESEYKTAEALVNKSIDTMANLRPKVIPSEKQQLAHWAVGLKDSFISKVKMMEYLMEELDDFSMHRTEEFGVMRQLWNKGREAEGNFKELQGKTLETISPHMDILLKAKDRIEAGRGTGLFEIEGAEMPAIMKEVGRDNWTAERAVSFLLNVGNEHNLQVLQNAYGYTKENIDAVSALFTTEELQAIQGVWNGINTLYQPLTDTNFRMHNRNLEKVDAQKITLKDNKGNDVMLEGGYYPLHFDRSISDVAQTQQELEVNKDASKGVLRSSKPKDAMTKVRGQQHSLPPLLSLSVLTRHIIETSRFITHSEYLRDINKVTKNKEWISMMKSKVGPRMYEELRGNLEFQANPKRKPTYSFDKWMDKSRSMSTSLILGLNMSVALKQRLSGFSAQVDLKGTWIAESLVDADLSGSILGKSSSKMWQEVRDKSKYIRAREGNIDREINDMISNMNPFLKKFSMKAFGKDVTLKDARDAMFFLIQANDRAMTGIVWKAAYNKSMDKSKDSLTAEEAEKKAITFADSIVAQTQPSALPLDVNAYQRSEGYTRLFTSFMTWTFKQGNRFIQKRKAMEAGAITRKEYIAHIVQEGVAAPVLAAIIGSMMISGELPDWWELGTAPIDYGLSWIPFVRDISGAYRYRRKIGESPAFEGANRLLHTGKTGFNWLNGDKEFNDFIWSLGRSAEALSGIPALKAAKNMRNTYYMATGQSRQR